MVPDEPPQRDALRMGRAGEVEIFDGTDWRPVSSLRLDPAMTSREEPPAVPADPDPAPDPGMALDPDPDPDPAGWSPEPDGSAGGPPGEAEQL